MVPCSEKLITGWNSMKTAELLPQAGLELADDRARAEEITSGQKI